MKAQEIFKRRQILINPKLQYMIVGFFGGIAILNLLFFVLALRFLNESMMMNIQGIEERTRTFLELTFASQYSSILQAVMGFALFSLLFSFVAGLILMQHVAGPAYAIKKYMDELIQGNVSRYPLKLRKNDFLGEVVESLNQLLSEKCPDIIADKHKK